MYPKFLSWVNDKNLSTLPNCDKNLGALPLCQIIIVMTTAGIRQQ